MVQWHLVPERMIGCYKSSRALFNAFVYSQGSVDYHRVTDTIHVL